jgi:aminoglycoside phosphotransferase (APT) family kinase protein
VPDTEQLSVDSAADYLRAAGLIPPDRVVQVEVLGGGISNTVLKLSWDDQRVVLKQSLPKLRVASEWFFDQRRTLIERDCLDLLGELIPGSVPDVLYFDETRSVLVIAHVPDGGVLWKDALLRGEVDLRAADHAGLLLGRIHRLAASDPRVPQLFADQTVLLQGRIDPYHRIAAAAHPALALAITREVERMLRTRTTLTLGDYSPKNLFIYDDRAMAIDVEVAHWGDPAFDVAFCLTHLLLKAIRFRGDASRYMAAAHVFWASYGLEAPGLVSETDVIAELGCLLLARIDGKSPIEYITDDHDKDDVRELAAELIITGGTSVMTTLERIQGEIVSQPTREVTR